MPIRAFFVKTTLHLVYATLLLWSRLGIENYKLHQILSNDCGFRIGSFARFFLS